MTFTATDVVFHRTVFSDAFKAKLFIWIVNFILKKVCSYIFNPFTQNNMVICSSRVIIHLNHFRALFFSIGGSEGGPRIPLLFYMQHILILVAPIQNLCSWNIWFSKSIGRIFFVFWLFWLTTVTYFSGTISFKAISSLFHQFMLHCICFHRIHDARAYNKQLTLL